MPKKNIYWKITAQTNSS